MKLSKKTAANQFEFPFIRTDPLSGPDPALRILCVEQVPEQRTQRPWIPIFADRAPGDDRYKIGRQWRIRG
jgi:hypothetical protein